MAIKLVASILACSSAMGCKCAAEDPTPAKASTPAPAAPTLPPGVDKKLLEELEKAAQDCRQPEGQSRIDCNGGTKNALSAKFNRNEYDRAGALPTFLYALEKTDKKLNALAASVLYASYRTSLGQKVEKDDVDAELARKLFTAVLKLPDSSAMQAIPAATHALTISDQSAALFDMLTDDVAIQVRTMAYRYAMVYGRMNAFEQIQEFGKSPAPAVVLSAIESPRNMQDWSVDEQQSVCPWVAQFVGDARAAVAGNALAALGNCGGKHLDTVLQEIEKASKVGQVTFIHATALRDLCGKGSPHPDNATEAQCKRARTLQENIAKDDRNQARVRSMSLSTVAYKWPDAQTLSLAKGLKTSKEGDVSRAATQIVTRLTPQLERGPASK